MNINGILLLDKAAGITSHRVVETLRKITANRSIGHTGTLDPMATGLLILCLGTATTLSKFFTKLDKEYSGEIVLGRTSNTYDAEGEVKIIVESPEVSREQIIAVFKKNVGEQLQIPPPFSAIRVQGKRLYEYARRGITKFAPERKVKIYKLELLDYTPPKIKFYTSVSSGTYIRSLAHKIGEELGCGAILSALRRTRIGKFEVSSAIDFNKLQESPEMWKEILITIYDAIDFLPRVIVDDRGLKRLSYGQPITLNQCVVIDESSLHEGREIIVFDNHRNFVAIAKARKDKHHDWRFFPQRVVMKES